MKPQSTTRTQRSMQHMLLPLTCSLLPIAGVQAAGSPETHTARKDSRPNVLIIHCDQLAAWTLGCYGGGGIETPNIDRLAAEGTLMTNFYANTPVSTPSRGCFLSGLYPNEHGAFKNDKQIRQDIPTFASELRDAGYATGYFGKWHLDGNPKRPGWDIRGKDMGWTDRTSMYSFGHYKILRKQPGSHPEFGKEVAQTAAEYPTDWFTDRAMDFMKAHKNRPFCAMLSIPDPHGPYLIRPPYDTMYPPETVEVPATLTEAPANDHFFYNESRHKVVDKKSGKTQYEEILQNIRKDKSAYLGEIKCIDDNVGRIIAFLKKSGLYDKTIIVFTADHGDMMGEHARMAKAVPLESSARIPFIIRYPKLVEQGVRSECVASCIDFYPTILALTGTTQQGSVSGRSLAPQLSGEQATWNDEAFLRCYASVFPWVGIVTKEYKLVYGEKDPDGKGLLIDRRKDPGERYNCFDDPAYSEVIGQLTDKIVRYCREHQDPHGAWLEKRIH